MKCQRERCRYCSCSLAFPCPFAGPFSPSLVVIAFLVVTSWAAVAACLATSSVITSQAAASACLATAFVTSKAAASLVTACALPATCPSSGLAAPSIPTITHSSPAIPSPVALV